jgi:hypothetical protein
VGAGGGANVGAGVGAGAKVGAGVGAAVAMITGAGAAVGDETAYRDKPTRCAQSSSGCTPYTCSAVARTWVSVSPAERRRSYSATFCSAVVSPPLAVSGAGVGARVGAGVGATIF